MLKWREQHTASPASPRFDRITRTDPRACLGNLFQKPLSFDRVWCCLGGVDTILHLLGTDEKMAIHIRGSNAYTDSRSRYSGDCGSYQSFTVIFPCRADDHFWRRRLPDYPENPVISIQRKRNSVLRPSLRMRRGSVREIATGFSNARADKHSLDSSYLVKKRYFIVKVTVFEKSELTILDSDFSYFLFLD